jgi:hypothetical protein
MASSFLIAVGLFVARKRGFEISSGTALVGSVALTTLIWMSVMFLTRPTDRATLVRFYELVRPAGPGWRRIRETSAADGSPDSLPMGMLGITLGLAAIYSALFGTGAWLYGRTSQALLLTAVFAASTIALVLLLPRVWRSADAVPAPER